MNHMNKGGQVFYLIGLQMSDHMPPDILWEAFLLGCQVLHLVFTKITMPGLVSFQDQLIGFGF